MSNKHYKIRRKCPNRCNPFSSVTQVQIKMKSSTAEAFILHTTFCLIRYHWVMPAISVHLLSVKRLKSILCLYNCVHCVLFDLSRQYLTSLIYLFFFSVTFMIFPLSAQSETLEEWVWRRRVEGKIFLISETFPLPFILISYKCMCLTIQKRNVK